MENKSISFNFSKKQEKSKVIQSEFGEKEEKAEDTDFVHSIDGTRIKGSKTVEKKKELVIPLITKNTWKIEDGVSIISKRNKSKNNGPSKTMDCIDIDAPSTDKKDDLERQAIRELLDSSGLDSTEVKDVPLLLINKVPEGFEEDDNLDVSLRPSEPTLEDYEAIPIEEFGMAMLRGMGWNKEEGIGLTNKKAVATVEPRLRPKGLGLGAERPQVTAADVKPNSDRLAKEDQLVLKKGAFVILNKGVNDGSYGKVEGFDEDNNRIIIQLAINGKVVTISQFAITLVSEAEYKKKGKILNNEMYEEYKRKHDEKQEKRDKDREDSRQAEKDSRNKDSSKKERQSDRDKAHSNGKSSKRPKEGAVEIGNSKSSDPIRDWVLPNLRVRFIDAKIKGGKYYERKFIVEDVVERNRFVLKSDEGDIIDATTIQLETVIPRKPPNLVCVLAGRHRGRVGTLIERDSRNEIGFVRIADHGVAELSFDDICEYVGNSEDYD